MSRRQKPIAPRKRTGTTSRARVTLVKKPSSRKKVVKRNGATGFLRSCLASAIFSFSAASIWLNPQWELDQGLNDLIAWVQGEDTSFPPLLSASGPVAQTSFSKCRQLFPSGATPIVPAQPALRELCFDSFAILHNGQTHTPVFVAQRLNRTMLISAREVQRTDRFYEEARLPHTERAALQDYRGSGYSRGHMAPAGDMHTPDAMAQSFSLANMVPQNQSHNAGAWNRIEQDTRNYVMRAKGDVYIYTGPAYAADRQYIGTSVAVPDYLFKLVYDPQSGRSWVHWQANASDTRAGRPIEYAEFVRRTGLRLLPETQR